MCGTEKHDASSIAIAADHRPPRRRTADTPGHRPVSLVRIYSKCGLDTLCVICSFRSDRSIEQLSAGDTSRGGVDCNQSRCHPPCTMCQVPTFPHTKSVFERAFTILRLPCTMQVLVDKLSAPGRWSDALLPSLRIPHSIPCCRCPVASLHTPGRDAPEHGRNEQDLYVSGALCQSLC